MTPTVLIVTGAGLTWALRVLFIAVVPANRLPKTLRRLLGQIGPAALAALVALDLMHHSGSAHSMLPALASAVVAIGVARLTRNLAATVVLGFAAAFIVGLLV
jgi:branched-subunit amino acid transport protein